jgi:gliding motility-associated-like protein
MVVRQLSLPLFSILDPEDHLMPMRKTNIFFYTCKAIAIVLLFLNEGNLFGQVPEFVPVDPIPQISPRASCFTSFAGTVRRPFLGTRAQSNDNLYLCLGDSLFINHFGDQDLTGDPNGATQPGIGYVFYSCPPTATGVSPLANIVASDPCIFKTTPPQPNGLLLARGQRLGNAVFVNSGFLQTTYAAGAPIQFHFAPITMDNFFSNPFYEVDPINGGPAGPCTNVTPSTSFEVTYLNPITISDITSNGCSGSIRVRGGLSEFNNSNFSFKSITLASDPSISGEFEGVGLRHNGIGNFVVHKPGIYNILIQDNKSCDGIAQVDMTNCPVITLRASDVTVDPGDNICVDVVSQNGLNGFTNIQVEFTFDPSVLTFVNVTGTGHPDIRPSDFNNNAPGRIRWLVSLSPPGIVLPSGSLLFRLCFRATGSIGSRSPIATMPFGKPSYVTYNDPDPIGFNFLDGSVTIRSASTDFTTTPTNVTCGQVPPQANGSIAINMTGGTGPFTVNWARVGLPPTTGSFIIPLGSTTGNIANLSAGDYDITITDVNNVVSPVKRVSITEPAAIGVGISSTSPLCFNGLGSARAEVSRGGVVITNPSGLFNFSWNVSPTNSPLITGITPQSVSVTITETATGCTASASTTLSRPQDINLTKNFTNPSCSGRNDGIITLGLVGGTGVLTTVFQNGPTFSTNNITRNNLAAGKYLFTVTDANGCQKVDSFTLTNLRSLSLVDIAIDSVRCNGQRTGSITVRSSVTGTPSFPLSLAWSANTPNFVTTTPVGQNIQGKADSLSAGSYSVTLTDGSGCFTSKTYQIFEPSRIVVGLVSSIPESCNPGGDGRVTVSVIGGNPRPGNLYSYNWGAAGPGNSSTISNLSARNDVVTVTDSKGCRATLPYAVTSPPKPVITGFDSVSVRCRNTGTGSLTVRAVPASGGSNIVRYEWKSNNTPGSPVEQTGDTYNNLPPGTYYVTVIDAAGCRTPSQATLGNPLPILLRDTLKVSPNCIGDKNGNINVSFTNGNPPYSVIWNGPDLVNFVTQSGLLGNLGSGLYSATVQDANNCNGPSFNVFLPPPPSIETTFSNIGSSSCQNTTDGRARVSARYSNGTIGLFNFVWDSGESTTNNTQHTATRLASGWVVVTITDQRNCEKIDSVFIPSPDTLKASSQTLISPVTCSGGNDGSISLVIEGGTGPYSVVWSNPPSNNFNLTGLRAGAYSADVSDAAGCRYQFSTILIEPDPLVLIRIDSLSSDVKCNGDSTGLLHISAVGGNQGASLWVWDPNVSSDSIARNLKVGTYSVSYTDSKGCRANQIFRISEPPPILAVIPTPEPPKCFGFFTLVGVTSASGGLGGPYTYSVDGGPPQILTDNTQVLAGDRLIAVFDNSGCFYEERITITEPDRIEVDLGPDLIVELGDSIILDPIITSQFPVDSFVWSFRPDNRNFYGFLGCRDCRDPKVKPLEDAVYVLRVFDENGCEGQDEIFIEVDKNRNVYFPTGFSPNNDGNNDKFIIYIGPGVQAVEDFNVYDRWGGLMFNAKNFTPTFGSSGGWDGTFNGTECERGIYTYWAKIRFIDGTVLTYRGDVTLVK